MFTKVVSGLLEFTNTFNESYFDDGPSSENEQEDMADESTEVDNVDEQLSSVDKQQQQQLLENKVNIPIYLIPALLVFVVAMIVIQLK